MSLEILNLKLDEYHLLKHPFYQAWSAGTLTLPVLGDYAKQYYHHVEAFPRYISTIHSNCPILEDRQILLDNLIDEEKGSENHPELWLRFTDGLGLSRNEIKDCTLNSKTKKLIEGFFKSCRKSYASGLGALYAYERQVPEVAKSKIAGLKKFYDISNEQVLKFFEVHQTADEWHSQEISDLISKLEPKDREVSFKASIKAAKLLWKFLDGINFSDCLNTN